MNNEMSFRQSLHIYGFVEPAFVLEIVALCLQFYILVSSHFSTIQVFSLF